MPQISTFRTDKGSEFAILLGDASD